MPPLLAVPVCPLHPLGRVRKAGRYGAQRQLQRFECLPDDGSAPHMLRAPIDPASPRPAGHRIPLDTKAQALSAVAAGMSFRSAGALVGVDGRAVRDWAAYYHRALRAFLAPAMFTGDIAVVAISAAAARSRQPRWLAGAADGQQTLISLGAGRTVSEAVGWMADEAPGRPDAAYCADTPADLRDAVAAQWPGTPVNAPTVGISHARLRDLHATMSEAAARMPGALVSSESAQAWLVLHELARSGAATPPALLSALTATHASDIGVLASSPMRPQTRTPHDH